MKEKTTSKREFAFEIKANDKGEYALVIVNEAKEELRRFPTNGMPEETYHFCTAHGLKQKMTDDTMASKLDKFDGDRLLACDALWARLLEGNWEAEREGLARPPEALIVLVMEKRNLKREVALASLKQYDKTAWDAMIQKNKSDYDAIAARLAKAKAEAPKVDLTDL